MRNPSYTHWRRTAATVLRRTLRGIGWLLTHGGRLLQRSGQLLHTLGRALNPAPRDPRRE